MDTMNITKIVGGLCGAFLIFLLLDWGVSSYYGLGESHAEGETVQGYVIATNDAAPATDTAATGPTFEELLASADVAKGKKIFSKCKACHKTAEGVNATGPSLYKVVNRPVGSIPDFSYSGTIAGLGGNWEPARLNDFLTKPGKYAPGTKMTFAGLKKAKDRANLIAFLETIGN
ncbi:MAG: cytochrome c family protein [Rhodobacterales bacterium]